MGQGEYGTLGSEPGWRAVGGTSWWPPKTQPGQARGLSGAELGPWPAEVSLLSVPLLVSRLGTSTAR